MRSTVLQRVDIREGWCHGARKVLETYLKLTQSTGYQPEKILSRLICWRSLRDSNPCYSIERHVNSSMAVQGHLRKYWFYRPF